MTDATERIYDALSLLDGLDATAGSGWRNWRGVMRPGGCRLWRGSA